MAKTEKDLQLFEVGCDDHVDAWVVAKTWEEATVEAARFWGVPWTQVAAYCYLKTKIAAPKRNVCARCGEHYFGKMPLCAACKLTLQTEEEQNQRRLKLAYQKGQVV